MQLRLTMAPCRQFVQAVPAAVAGTDSRLAHQRAQLVEAQRRDGKPARRGRSRCWVGARRSRRASSVGTKGRPAGEGGKRRPTAARCRAGRARACCRGGRVRAGCLPGRGHALDAGRRAECCGAGAAAGAAAAKVQRAHGGRLQLR
jgi:hypothetical protein